VIDSKATARQAYDTLLGNQVQRSLRMQRKQNYRCCEINSTVRLGSSRTGIRSQEWPGATV